MVDSKVSKLGVAAEDFLQLAGRLQPMIALAEALKEFKSIEDSIDERKRALADLDVKHKAAVDGYEQARVRKDAQDAELKKARADHEAWLARTKDKAIADGKEEADRLVATATAEATAIVEKAKADAKAARDQATAAVNIATQRRHELQQEIIALDAAAEEKSKVVDELDAKLTTLRAAAKSIAG